MSKAILGFAFGPAAADFLNKMDAGKIRKQLVKKAKNLMVDPHPSGSKKLHDRSVGKDPVWRVRSGDYRILYVVRSMEIVVIDIDNRKDVYR